MRAGIVRFTSAVVVKIRPFDYPQPVTTKLITFKIGLKLIAS